MSTPLAGRPDPRRREPLWDRVDRNRFRLVAYLVVFAVVCSVAIGAGIAFAAAALLALSTVAEAPRALVPGLRWLLSGGVWRIWMVALFLALVYEAWALGRSEKWLVRRLDAGLVPKGVLLETKMALKDMAIASGQDVAPALYVMDTPNVNAFVFKAPGRRAVLGVTHGLVDKLSLREQRAVFANLVARLASGDTMVSSAVTSLLAPLQWYRGHRIRALDVEDAFMRKAAERRKQNPAAEDTSPLSSVVLLLPFLAPMILAGEILAAAQRRSQLTAAEKADAEGMLLLKDPDPMLSALERCVRLNNNVPLADESLGDIFYCWTGDSTDDEDDPEWQRVKRLREVLGVWGWVPDDTPASLIHTAASTVPPAPRLEERRDE